MLSQVESPRSLLSVAEVSTSKGPVLDFEGLLENGAMGIFGELVDDPGFEVEEPLLDNESFRMVFRMLLSRLSGDELLLDPFADPKVPAVVVGATTWLVSDDSEGNGCMELVGESRRYDSKFSDCKKSE